MTKQKNCILLLEIVDMTVSCRSVKFTVAVQVTKDKVTDDSNRQPCIVSQSKLEGDIYVNCNA